MSILTLDYIFLFIHYLYNVYSTDRLARALYSSAKVIILDDVLSAVDAHTSAHIQRHCLSGPLIKGRTCILVTHAVSQCASLGSFIVCMSRGQVERCGDPIKLGFVDNGEMDDHVEAEEKAISSKKPTENWVLNERNEEQKVEALRLIMEEERMKGAVSMGVYKYYLDAFGGWKIFGLCLSVFVLKEVVSVVRRWLLKEWVASYEDYGNTETMHRATSTQMYYLKTYQISTVLFLFMNGFEDFNVLQASVFAAKNIYGKFIRGLMGANVRFFDQTPLGRIINRATRDISTVDAVGQKIAIFLDRGIM